MRLKVRKQLKDQEEVCKGLKMKIDENNITITLLQTRLEEVMRAIDDKEKAAIMAQKHYQDELEAVRNEAQEEQLKMIADIKLERGDFNAERERALALMKQKEEELERKLRELAEATEKDKSLMLSQLEEEKA